MNKQNLYIVATLLFGSCLPTSAQYTWQEGAEAGKLDLCENVDYHLEMQGSFSNSKTPLWLNANKYGLSSLDKNNAYFRAALQRPLSVDSARRWAVGYGVDLAVPVGYTSHFVLQQAYVEARWLHGVLFVGSKEYPMELKNQNLSSGSQTLGINARPVPQVRLALPQYWTLPLSRGWLHLKGHVAYGVMTDGKWQRDFTQRKSRYAENVIYHSKAGYLCIGNEECFCPWSFELGLEMAAEFGGKPYIPDGNGGLAQMPTDSSLKGFWHAFFPGGADATDGLYTNVAGDQLGSWVMRLNYEADRWRLGFYLDHFFEDHSQMFFLDYNGYGEKNEWQEHKSSKYFRYALKDVMLGAELNLKYGSWLKNVVLEYLYTKYQSGPYNHDHTVNIPDHVAGVDDYYNHGDYPGWQHWGQVIGNPLYRSPIYNTNGRIWVMNNRFVAYHLGWDGDPTDHLGYRCLFTYQKGWGTYNIPFCKMHHNVSFLVELKSRFRHGWSVKGAYGMDFGSKEMLGHNAGFQITIGKVGVLGMKNPGHSKR